MARIAIRRLVWSVPLLFVASTLTFFLVSLIPGNAAVTILGAHATPSQIQLLTRQLGLSAPPYVQYGHWLGAAVRGNLGTSVITGQPVTSLLGASLIVTVTLIIAGSLASAVLGVSLGVMSALGSGFVGRLVDALSLAGLALPNFWLALVLDFLFAVALRLLPATGFVPFSASPSAWLKSLILPVAALGLGGATVIAKQTRDAMLNALSQEYVLVMQANGFSRRSIVFRHALRNAAVPILTVVGVVAVSLIGGTVLVETIFSLPGLGSAAVQASISHDLPVIQGIVICFTLIVIVTNLLTDLACSLVNPKVRGA